MAPVFTVLMRFYPNSSIFMLCFCQCSSSDVIICSIFIHHHESYTYFVWIFDVESELLKTVFCQGVAGVNARIYRIVVRWQ